MSKTSARRPPVKLDYRDGEVVVTPADRDVFFISAEKATQACREAVQADERVARFTHELLVPLREWCAARSSRVSACFIPLPAGHVQVFIVTSSPRFDFDLAEEVAELERRLAEAGWRVSVSQLPASDEETLATFFNPDGALQVYAER
jgi:hypothetical protein